jgi:hypothetical protein
MKKVLLALAAVAYASTASATIATGAHDLSGTGPGTYGVSTLSSCQFCHAPHNANTAIAGTPLWNRKIDATFAGTFTKYSSTTLLETNVVLGANSLTCLSCHDGVTDMGDTFTGSKGFAVAKTMNNTFRVIDATNPTASPRVGKGLGDDHPVGVHYPAATNTQYVDRATAATNGVLFYSDGAAGFTVECGTCHDPHGESDGKTGSGANGLKSFLRVTASTICSTCQNK